MRLQYFGLNDEISVTAPHDMGFARAAANRLAFIDHGKIIEEGPPEQIFSQPREARTKKFFDQILSH